MGPNDLEISEHARRRMAQRGIKLTDLIVTLSSPDEVCHTPEPSWRYSRTFVDGRTLKVWTPELIENQSPKIVVKSAAWKDVDRDE